MNRYLTFSLAISITLSTPAISLRAANKPRAGKPEGATVLWTNNGLESLRAKGLISVVGQVAEEATTDAAAPSSYIVETQDPGWYAEQASKLRAELESREAKLQHYRQTLEDVRDLKTVTGGINLEGGDIGITPDAGIEILRQRVQDTEGDLDALEDLARRNGIQPGTLRGR
jgi:hypothetical protein